MTSLSGTKRGRHEDQELATEEEDVYDLTDTEAALQLIASSIVSRDVPRGAFVHQIYTVLNNKTDVDSTLQRLRTKKSLKVLYCPLDGLSPTESQFYVMKLADYLSDIDSRTTSIGTLQTRDSCQDEALVKFRPWISFLSERSSVHRDVFKKKAETAPESAPESVSESESESSSKKRCDIGSSSSSSSSSNVAQLLDDYVGAMGGDAVGLKEVSELLPPEPLSDLEIDYVIRGGFLRRRRDTMAEDILWFSHPMVGSIANWVTSTRKDIVAAIKRTKFKELSERELQKRKLSSPLGLKFHLAECVGCGVLRKFEAPGGGGAIYRLPA